MINHMCAQCQQDLQIPDEYAGQQGTCPKCGASFTIPMPYAPEASLDQGGTGQAVASLILGILSFACLSLLGALPAIVLGHSALSRIRRGMMPAHAWGMAVAGLILGYLNVAVTVVSIALLVAIAVFRVAPVSMRAAPELQTCQNNLKQMGIVFKMYAAEHRGFFPLLSPQPGQLMAIKDEIYPEYVTDVSILLCPTEQIVMTGPPLVDDESYFYLGYVVTNDREVAAYCKAYQEHVAQGLPFEHDFAVPMGEGVGGSDKLFRLKEGVERFLITDIGNPASANIIQSAIPVLIERPENHGPQIGGNVLFMDGHVERIPYPGKWPMTQETIDALLELDAMGK